MAQRIVSMDALSALHVFNHELALRRCRDKGVTYLMLSNQTGRGLATWRNWLRGDSDPPTSMVSVLALLLDLHPGDLYRPMTETDRVIEVRPMLQVRTTPRRRRLVRRNSMAS